MRKFPTLSKLYALNVFAGTHLVSVELVPGSLNVPQRCVRRACFDFRQAQSNEAAKARDLTVSIKLCVFNVNASIRRASIELVIVGVLRDAGLNSVSQATDIRIHAGAMGVVCNDEKLSWKIGSVRGGGGFGVVSV